MLATTSNVYLYPFLVDIVVALGVEHLTKFYAPCFDNKLQWAWVSIYQWRVCRNRRFVGVWYRRSNRRWAKYSRMYHQVRSTRSAIIRQNFAKWICSPLWIQTCYSRTVLICRFQWPQLIVPPSFLIAWSCFCEVSIPPLHCSMWLCIASWLFPMFSPRHTSSASRIWHVRLRSKPKTL